MNIIGAILTCMFAVIIIVMIVTLPFAFFGWALVTFLSLFLDLGDFSYWSYAGTGLATSVVFWWFQP